jgi:hypothetical protein
MESKNPCMLREMPDFIHIFATGDGSLQLPGIY